MRAIDQELEQAFQRFIPQAKDVQFQQLQAIPGLGKTYSQVAAGALRRKDKNQSLQLPGTGFEVRGHQISRAEVDQFNGLIAPTGNIGHDAVPSVGVHIAAFPLTTALMVEPDFPLPLLGMVHLEHTVWHEGPIGIDVPLRIRTWAQNLAQHRAGTSVEMWAQVFDEQDQLVWQSCALYLARGIRLPDSDNSVETESAARKEFSPPVSTATWRFPADSGRQYAKVSGDVNPIHLSGPTAKLLGMKTAIAHGMYAAAKVLESREPHAPFKWTIQFQTPIVLPSSVDIAYSTPQRGHTAAQGWNARKKRPHFQALIVR